MIRTIKEALRPLSLVYDEVFIPIFRKLFLNKYNKDNLKREIKIIYLLFTVMLHLFIFNVYTCIYSTAAALYFIKKF